jgi:hypothetical protein
MADVEPQITESSSGESPSNSETSASQSLHPTSAYGSSSGLRGPSKRSGITWWEACGGWSSRYSLSL